MSHARGHAQWRGHLHLPFECGICAQPVKMRSLCYALISTPDSLAFQEITPAFVFPLAGTGSGGTSSGDMDSIVRVGDWAIGARYIVEPDPPGRCVECAVVHHDCLRMYQSCLRASPLAEVAALQYLWSVALWRQPWNRSWTIQRLRPLPREGLICSKAALSRVLKKLSMPDFAVTLPWEIVTDIFELSSRALLWRAARAATLALDAQQEDVDEKILLVQALHIKSWDRGNESAKLLKPDAERLPMIRFTIDSQGVDRIERIEKLQSLEFRYSIQDVEYVAVDEKELESVQVAFKNGRARLQIPQGHHGFTSWDIPRPPPVPYRHATVQDGKSEWVSDGLSLSRMGGEAAPANRFHIAALQGATGLTFIFDKNFLASIHAHTPRQPIAELPHDTNVLKELGGSAMEQFSRLSWVYLPLPPGEKILAIGCGSDGTKARIRRPGIIVHTKLAGTVFVGHSMPTSNQFIALGEEPEVLFTRLQVSFVSGIGAFSTKPIATPQYIDKVRRIPQEMMFGHFDAFRLTSYASLDGVVRLDVVEEPTIGALRGLVLYYSNGAQRALGQYKIGHHTIKTYMRPTCLCLGRQRRQLGRQFVHSIYAAGSPSTEQGHELHTRANGRACYRIQGFVRAQFDSDSISLRFATTALEVADSLQGAVPMQPALEPF